MSTTVGPAKIAPYKGADYVRIAFRPDLARFKMASLDADTVALLSKRVYDMAGVLGKSVAVSLNGSRIPISNFQEYTTLYVLPEVRRRAARNVGLTQSRTRV
jgi:DNA topoisomerase-2